MRIFSETTNRSHISVLRDMPTHIEYNSGRPSIAHFTNGETDSLGCIGCVNPKCMRFGPHEIMCSEVENFPNDQSPNTCAIERKVPGYFGAHEITLTG